MYRKANSSINISGPGERGGDAVCGVCRIIATIKRQLTGRVLICNCLLSDIRVLTSVVTDRSAIPLKGRNEWSTNDAAVHRAAANEDIVADGAALDPNVLLISRRCRAVNMAADEGTSSGRSWTRRQLLPTAPFAGRPRDGPQS